MNRKKGITLYLNGLPCLEDMDSEKDNAVGDGPKREYEFYIGRLHYVPQKEAIFLHIPEIPHRDAEGRPLYDEQNEWVNELLKKITSRPKIIGGPIGNFLPKTRRKD